MQPGDGLFAPETTGYGQVHDYHSKGIITGLLLPYRARLPQSPIPCDAGAVTEMG